MSQAVELPDAVFARLRAEADRRGVGIGTVLTELTDQLPATVEGKPSRRLAFVAAGASTAGITPRMSEILVEGFGRDPQR